MPKLINSKSTQEETLEKNLYSIQNFIRYISFLQSFILHSYSTFLSNLSAHWIQRTVTQVSLRCCLYSCGFNDQNKNKYLLKKWRLMGKWRSKLFQKPWPANLAKAPIGTRMKVSFIMLTFLSAEFCAMIPRTEETALMLM